MGKRQGKYDINTEKAVRKQRIYYHVTSIENIEQILKEGLRANEEGHIFVFTEMFVADEIAKNQCGLMEYAVVKINSKGITGKVIMDRVAEFSAWKHRIIIQEKVSEKFLSFMDTFKVDFTKPTPFDLLKLNKLEGIKWDDTVKVWHERNAEWAAIMAKQEQMAGGDPG